MPITNSLITASGGSAAANIYVSAGNTAVTTLYLCNTSNGAVTVNVFAVSPGGNANITASPTLNMLYYNLTIAGNDTYVIDSERLLLSSGDSLRANTSPPSSVVATVSFTSI